MCEILNIVITGFGVNAPGINNIEELKNNLEQGICTLEEIKDFGLNDSSIVAGKIPHDYLIINEKNYKRYPRVSRLAIKTADDAVTMAKISKIDRKRISIVMGTSVGGLQQIQREIAPLGDEYRKYPIHGINFGDPHVVSSAIASHFGVKGPVHTITTGCTASSDAIALGKLLLESKQTDVCIVGGADAFVDMWSIFGFHKLKQIELNKRIGETGVPFSNQSSGFVMSEGAGVLVLEREEDALQRQAQIYGVIARTYSNNDGLEMFQSDMTGSQMLDALQNTILDEVPTYINSQALGLRVNDSIEATVHQQLFGNKVPITSIKGLFGHTFGAMGAIQVISALITIEHNFIPKTMFTRGDGYEQLPIVYETKYVDVEKVAITSHGNGGNNTCILVNKY